jgi:hypothetical protein
VKGEAWTDPPSDAALREQERRARLAAILAERRFDHTKDVPDPEPRMTVSGVVIGTPGNLLVVSAAKKAGKTAFIGACIASAIAPVTAGADTFGVEIAPNPAGNAVIHLDTEQPEPAFYKVVKRALRRAGVTEPPPWFSSHWLLGKDIDDIRASLRVAFEQAAKACGAVHLAVVDGVGDLIVDLNETKIAMPLVTELHALAIEFGCLIVLVLHTNPGSEKTRGHLGSHLERKAETNLRLEMDQYNVTTIYTESARGAPIPKHAGPAFVFSDEERMHVSTDNPNAKPCREPSNVPQDVVELLGNQAMGAKEWMAKARTELGISERTFYRLKKLAVKLKLVLQNPADERWFRA